MNPQQLPGPLGPNGEFNTLNGLPIHWRDKKRGVTHKCEGADVQPGVRLIWTLCEIDTNAAYLPDPPDADPITCDACKART